MVGCITYKNRAKCPVQQPSVHCLAYRCFNSYLEPTEVFPLPLIMQGVETNFAMVPLNPNSCSFCIFYGYVPHFTNLHIVLPGEDKSKGNNHDSCRGTRVHIMATDPVCFAVVDGARFTRIYKNQKCYFRTNYGKNKFDEVLRDIHGWLVILILNTVGHRTKNNQMLWDKRQ